MSFMQPQIQFGQWVRIDGPMGTEYIPADLVDTSNLKLGETLTEGLEQIIKATEDYRENREVYEVELIQGWGARLSAPGYMDCTSWSVYDTESEARESLEDETEDDDHDDDDDHEHIWGPVERAPLTGNPHRKCQVCGFVSLDLDDNEEDSDDESV